MIPSKAKNSKPHLLRLEFPTKIPNLLGFLSEFLIVNYRQRDLRNKSSFIYLLSKSSPFTLKTPRKIAHPFVFLITRYHRYRYNVGGRAPPEQPRRLQRRRARGPSQRPSRVDGHAVGQRQQSPRRGGDPEIAHRVRLRRRLRPQNHRQQRGGDERQHLGQRPRPDRPAGRRGRGRAAARLWHHKDSYPGGHNPTAGAPLDAAHEPGFRGY